ncbi:MAG: hypothetical protein ACT4OK_02300 [Gemmobacter sp.]
MSPDIVAALHPPRLPAAFTAPQWQDFLSAFGIGLLLAALILTVAAPALHRRPRAPRLADRLRATGSLPRQERMVSLARLLAETGGTLPEDQRAALYSGQGDNPEMIEGLIRQAGARRAR